MNRRKFLAGLGISSGAILSATIPAITEERLDAFKYKGWTINWQKSADMGQWTAFRPRLAEICYVTGIDPEQNKKRHIYVSCQFNDFEPNKDFKEISKTQIMKLIDEAGE